MVKFTPKVNLKENEKNTSILKLTPEEEKAIEMCKSGAPDEIVRSVGYFFKGQLAHLIKEHHEKVPSGWKIDEELNMAIHPEFLKLLPVIAKRWPISEYINYENGSSLNYGIPQHIMFMNELSLKYALPEIIQNFRDTLRQFNQKSLTKKELQTIMRIWVLFISMDRKKDPDSSRIYGLEFPYDMNQSKYPDLIKVIQEARLPYDVFDSPQDVPYLFNQEAFDPLSDLPASEAKAIASLGRILRDKLGRGWEYMVSEGHVSEFDIGQEFGLTKANFNAIFNQIGKFSMLQCLDVYNRLLEYCPPALRNLKHLKILSLLNLEGEKEIQSLPRWFGELTELEELHIGTVSQDFEFPSSMINLIKLKKIDIRGEIYDYWNVYRLVYKKKSLGLISGWESWWEQMNEDPELMEALKEDAQVGDSDLEQDL
jgi:hypothetical protein